MNIMRTTITALAIALMPLSMAAQKVKQLTILHTNDTHSCILPVSKNLADTTLAGRGGFARRVAVLNEERKKDPDLLYFDSGDFSQGSAYEVFKDSMDKMVDRSCDEETNIALENLVVRVPGVEHLDSLHTRLFGNRIYVDIELSVKDDLTLLQAHHIAETVHTAIEANFPLVKHCMVHVNPLSEDSHDACIMLPPDLRPKNLRPEHLD